MISTMDEAKPNSTQSAPPRLGLSSHLFSPLQRTAPVPRRLKTHPVLEGARSTGDATLFGLEGIASSNEGRRSSLGRASGAAQAGGKCKEGGRRGGRNELLSLDGRREGGLGENEVTYEEQIPSSTTASPSRHRPNLRPSSPFVDRTNNNSTQTSSLPTPTPPPSSPQAHKLSLHHTSQSWDNLLGVHPSSSSLPSPISNSSGRALPPTASSPSPSPLLLRHQPYPSNNRATKSLLSSNSNSSSFGTSSSSIASKQGTGARPFTPPGRALLAPPPSSSTPPPTNFTIITSQRSLSSRSTDSDTSSSSSSSPAKPNPDSANLASPTTSPRLLVVPLAPPISRRVSVGAEPKKSTATASTLLTVVPSPPLSLATLELDDDDDHEKRGLLTVEQAGTMTWGHVDTPTVEMKEEEKGLCLGLGQALGLEGGGEDEGGGGDGGRDADVGGRVE